MAANEEAVSISDTDTQYTTCEHTYKITTTKYHDKLTSFLLTKDKVKGKKTNSFITKAIIAVFSIFIIICFIEMSNVMSMFVDEDAYPDVSTSNVTNTYPSPTTNTSQWFLNKINVWNEKISSSSVDGENLLSIQPMYRNYLLQALYEYSLFDLTRLDSKDPIFQHVSMTYGGPWTVPPQPNTTDTINSSAPDSQNDSKYDAEPTIDKDSDVNIISFQNRRTEKVFYDKASNVNIQLFQNGRNSHTFQFGNLEHGYTNDINAWYCYLFHFSNADYLEMNKKLWNWKDYSFKITTTIDNIDMENGYDFVRLYVNSQYKGQTFTGKSIEPQTLMWRVDYNYLSEWKDGDVPTFELCFNVITDNTVTGKGFDITTIIEYENPQIVKWNDPVDSECLIVEPTWRNRLYWDGSCGIGVKTRNISQCVYNTTSCKHPVYDDNNYGDESSTRPFGDDAKQVIGKLNIDEKLEILRKDLSDAIQAHTGCFLEGPISESFIANCASDNCENIENLNEAIDKCLEEVSCTGVVQIVSGQSIYQLRDDKKLRDSPRGEVTWIKLCGNKKNGLYCGVCDENETQKQYCIKEDCGDEPVNEDNPEIKRNPKLKYHFNGHGRIDPIYPDPFTIQRSKNTEINIDNMIQQIETYKQSIFDEYSDVRVLTNAVQQHNQMDDSKIRLGIKLARSLILGDDFHIVFTGSSNTAGSSNQFMSSYPMQLQSIMRDLWKIIGYKGAAFRVSNHAFGGGLGTNQIAWCIPAITGGDAEKIDVVFWESVMSDAGSDSSRQHTIENHIRNSLSLYGGTYNNNNPNRPVWHAVVAGYNGNEPKSFDEKKLMYAGYKDLVEQYSNYGAGIVEFIPSLGINPMKQKDPENWNDERFYSWGPGPLGHRIYAEIIAYFYLDAALTVLKDVKQTFDNFSGISSIQKNVPRLWMLDFLKDPPYQQSMDETIKCNPLCTDAVHSRCILGYNPKDQVYDIQKYVVNADKWSYEQVRGAGNPQPIDQMTGGQAPINNKYCYNGNKSSGKLTLVVKIEGHNYLMVENPYCCWGGISHIIQSMPEWFNVEVVDVIDISIENNKNESKDKIIQETIGEKLKCETSNYNGADDIWNNDIMDFGCVIKFSYSGKYKIAFTVDTNDEIPICVIASY